MARNYGKEYTAANLLFENLVGIPPVDFEEGEEPRGKLYVDGPFFEPGLSQGDLYDGRPPVYTLRQAWDDRVVEHLLCTGDIERYSGSRWNTKHSTFVFEVGSQHGPKFNS